MTQGVIWKQLLEFSIPMAIGLLFQQLYKTVDAVVYCRLFCMEAIASVGSTGSIINMLVGFCAGLATGASVVISQCYGAHDNERLRDAVHTTIVVTFIMCAVVTVLGLLIVQPMLRMMSTPDDVMGEASEYLTIYFAGVSGLLFYNMGSGVLRAVGDSRRPLYFLCFSAVVNTVFDLLFVIVFHMGVAGVAYATILSQMLSAVLVMVVLTRDHAAYGVRWRQLCLKKEMLSRIFGIGMPSGVQQAITSFSNVFVQGYINFFGSACMAGWSGYNKLDVFILIPVHSLALASTTFVCHNYGAKQLRRAREGVTQTLRLSLIVTVLLSAVLMLCARPLLTLFSTDPEVLDFGTRFILLVSPFYFTICFNQIYSGALRGVGNAKTPTIIMLISFVAFRQLYLLVNRWLGNGFVPVALAYPVGWILCSALLILTYRRSALCRAEETERA